ncbi:hypothetical protein PAEPH01_0032 [Pancytospora epiphaga]|nr:hypothetical protein PAEPH01_0032 [Pancytospora epiphaga]
MFILLLIIKYPKGGNLPKKEETNKPQKTERSELPTRKSSGSVKSSMSSSSSICEKSKTANPPVVEKCQSKVEEKRERGSENLDVDSETEIKSGEPEGESYENEEGPGNENYFFQEDDRGFLNGNASVVVNKMGVSNGQRQKEELRNDFDDLGKFTSNTLSLPEDEKEKYKGEIENKMYSTITYESKDNDENILTDKTFNKGPRVSDGEQLCYVSEQRVSRNRR